MNELLPPPTATFLGPKTTRHNVPGQFTHTEKDYNCRLTRSKQIARSQAAQPAPVRDGWRKLFEFLT